MPWLFQLLHEQSHPIPTIPFTYSRGTTHSWMEQTWMVDGEALVMTMATISSESPSRQGARMEFLSPELGFLVAAEFGSVSRNFLRGSSVLGHGKKYRRRGIGRRHPRGLRHPLARVGPGPRPRVVQGPWWAPWLPPLASVLFRSKTFYSIFSGIFLRTLFLHKKRHHW